MAARAIATASISFGLVTVPVRIYPATRSSAGLSFHLLHEKDHARLKQQYVCEKDGEVVPRSETVKGYEFAKQAAGDDPALQRGRGASGLRGADGDQGGLGLGGEAGDAAHRVDRGQGVQVQGKDITAPAPQKRQAEVVDLMEALQASLARKGQTGRAGRSRR